MGHRRPPLSQPTGTWHPDVFALLRSRLKSDSLLCGRTVTDDSYWKAELVPLLFLIKDKFCFNPPGFRNRNFTGKKITQTEG